MPLIEPFIIAYTSYETKPAIIIKVTSDIGIIGYGESVPDEHVTGESVYTALKHHLIPAVLNRDPRNIQKNYKLMNQALVQNGTAKAAIDIACYDILGKVSKLPIYSLLGGRKNIEELSEENLHLRLETSGLGDFHLYTLLRPQIKAIMLALGADVEPV